MKNFLELKHPVDDLQNPPFSFVSDLIEHLQKIKEEHGNLLLTTHTEEKGVISTHPVKVKVSYIREKRHGETNWTYRDLSTRTPSDKDFKVLEV